PSASWPDIAGRLEGRTHVLPVRVYYEDTDFSGVVYHAGYFRFCERGRSDYLRHTGINHAALHDGSHKELHDGGGVQAGKLAFAVARIEADFLGAARIDDLLEVRTRYTGMTAARILIDQNIRYQDKTLFAARVTVVLLNEAGRPQRITGTLARRLGVLLPD
ncbi:MAG: YbgC/FadM family acyl-CoA thioesterase, partial [Hyphomicrobiales bacterium]